MLNEIYLHFGQEKLFKRLFFCFFCEGSKIKQSKGLLGSLKIEKPYRKTFLSRSDDGNYRKRNLVFQKMRSQWNEKNSVGKDSGGIEVEQRHFEWR